MFNFFIYFSFFFNFEIIFESEYVCVFEDYSFFVGWRSLILKIIIYILMVDIDNYFIGNYLYIY